MSDKSLILVVDDDKSIRKLLSSVVERSPGMVPVACSDTEAARKVYRDNGDRVRAIFVDYMMPGGTGVEFVAYVRRLDRQVPIIAITACDDSHQAFLAAGVDAILAKPFCVKTVSQMVNQYACRGASSGRLPAIGGCGDGATAGPAPE